MMLTLKVHCQPHKIHAVTLSTRGHDGSIIQLRSSMPRYCLSPWQNRLAMLQCRWQMAVMLRSNAI